MTAWEKEGSQFIALQICAFGNRKQGAMPKKSARNQVSWSWKWLLAMHYILRCVAYTKMAFEILWESKLCNKDLTRERQ